MRVTGRMEMNDDGTGWRMRLPDGAVVELVASEKGTRLQNSAQPLNPTWAKGFLSDNFTITVRGEFGTDGKFQVEDFSPGCSDRYVSGRVQLRLGNDSIARGDPRSPQATVVVNTAGGDVVIADATLALKFRLAGPLGVILPGEAKTVGGRLTYDRAPERYFALARPQPPPNELQPRPIANADGTFSTKHVMAYNGFDGTVVVADANAVARVNHMDRNWLLGDFVLSSPTQLGEFRAVYVSRACGTQPAPMATAPVGAAPAAIAEQSRESPPVDVGAFNLRNGGPRATETL